MKVINTPLAPTPVGPYSQAIKVGCFLFISGQIPIDPQTGHMVEGDFKAKVKRVMDNIKAIVEAAGGTIDRLVKVTVFIRDLSLFGEFNEVYASYFSSIPPARSTVGVSSLPRGADIEIEAVAYLCEEG